MPLKHLLILGFLLTPATALAQQTPHTITVQGHGSVMMHPDYASIALGVVAKAPTVGEAMHANAQTMTKVVAAIRGQGVAADDIHTAQFLVEEVHARFPNGEEDNDHIVAYTVTNKVTVTIHDLGKIAAVIDAAGNAGANIANSVTFGVTDPQKYLDAAQVQAVRDARHRAEVMAEADHATVGPAITMSTTRITTPSYSSTDYQSVPVAVNNFRDLQFHIPTNSPILPGTMYIEADAYATFVLSTH